MTERSDVVRVDAATRDEIEAWLYDEAELLDTRRWREWLARLAGDVRYRMPVAVTVERRSAGTAVGGGMVHLDEDRYTLEKRIERLEGGHAWTEDPPSRTRRFVTNVVARPAREPGEVEVRSYVLLYRSRGDDRPADVLSAARTDRLRRGDDGWLLARRDITVDDAVLRMQNLAVLL